MSGNSGNGFPGFPVTALHIHKNGTFFHHACGLNIISGPRGPIGQLGPQGDKGEAGSFDFFMLMMADLRHDLEQLQSRVYPGRERSLPRYNMQQHMAWEQKMKEKHASTSLHNNQPLYKGNLVTQTGNDD